MVGTKIIETMILKYIFNRVVALIGLLVLWPVLLIGEKHGDRRNDVRWLRSDG